MPKNIREEFLHLCHLHPRLASNDVDDEESAMQWETSWGSTESSSGHDATQQPVTRLHWGETSPSLSSGFSNWFLHREGLGKLTIWNGHRKNETRKCSSKAEWTRPSEGQLITFDRSVITADHRAQHTPRVHIENAAWGNVFEFNSDFTKKYFLFIVGHRDKPARRIIWLSNSNKKHENSETKLCLDHRDKWASRQLSKCANVENPPTSTRKNRMMALLECLRRPFTLNKRLPGSLCPHQRIVGAFSRAETKPIKLGGKKLRVQSMLVCIKHWILRSFTLDYSAPCKTSVWSTLPWSVVVCFQSVKPNQIKPIWPKIPRSKDVGSF